MTIQVLARWTRTSESKFDVTSGSGYLSALSPFKLGPCELYGPYNSWNMENGWQYAKVYPGYENSGKYFDWALEGWNNRRAVRYPMGKGAKPLYSLWDGEKLDYIEARKQIYIPLYANAVRKYAAGQLDFIRGFADKEDIVILDYDAYDHRKLGYSWDDVINDQSRKMGHGFVLAMMLEGKL